MSLLDKIKKVLFDETSVSQEFVVQEMKGKIKALEDEYNRLVDIQSSIIENPRIILNMDFLKKEKYIEIMDKVKYKNINLIKEYEYQAIKYNILIELYNKLKCYIANIEGDIIITFNFDKYKQPVVILSPYESNLHKILLIKNTFYDEDYIMYKINQNQDIEINGICSKEQNVNHGKFMMDMLFKTSIRLKEIGLANSNKIVVTKHFIREYCKDNEAFFIKQGFRQHEGMFVKTIQTK